MQPVLQSSVRRAAILQVSILNILTIEFIY